LKRWGHPIIELGFTLRTDLFEATTPGPDFINDRCFGEDFAIWRHWDYEKSAPLNIEQASVEHRGKAPEKL
jgi:hypothetical protein